MAHPCEPSTWEAGKWQLKVTVSCLSPVSKWAGELAHLFGRVFVASRKNVSLTLRTHTEDLGIVARVCNPSAEEPETDWSLISGLWAPSQKIR